MGGEKPTGIVILVVLYAIEGLFALAAGGMMIGGGTMFSSMGGLNFPAALLSVAGAILIIIALIDFAIAYGLWKLQAWARMAAIIFAIIGLLGFPIGTIISIIILWYLFKPEIKEAFGASK